VHETPQGRLTNSTFLATSRDSVLLDSNDRNPDWAEAFGMLASSKQVVEKIQMSNRNRPQLTINHAVDDQPAKLLSYEVILHGLGENLIKAHSASEAFEHLLNTDIAVLLIDVCMPQLDGFQLASMIREHPRFQKTAIIFISAVHLTDEDLVRGYEMGAVDYVPVPVVPEVLRAKVRVFIELYRKTKQLEALNQDLEMRVRDRMAELESAMAQLQQSDQLRSLALAAGQMGSWTWNVLNGNYVCDEGQCRIFGINLKCFELSADDVKTLVHPDDRERVQ
jgi:PleD family two-component response regulator